MFGVNGKTGELFNSQHQVSEFGSGDVRETLAVHALQMGVPVRVELALFTIGLLVLMQCEVVDRRTVWDVGVRNQSKIDHRLQTAIHGRAMDTRFYFTDPGCDGFGVKVGGLLIQHPQHGSPTRRQSLPRCPQSAYRLGHTGTRPLIADGGARLSSMA